MAPEAGGALMAAAKGRSQPMTPARVGELGIVGAGGGGFPTAVKLGTRVPLVIANAAECEPLLHKDKELLHHLSEPFLRGMLAAMEMVGAPQGVIGIKEKYHDIIAAMEQQAPSNIRVATLPDSYPAGDEFILVHIVTGRVIPPGGLPKDVDAMVANVETLMNIGLDQPVTQKYLTVAGAVRNPITLRVPIGITIGEVIAAAGGATVDDFSVLLGGVMMAQASRRPRCSRHQDHRRHHCPSLIAQPDPAPRRQVAGDCARRPLGLRPVPLLHRVLPALSAGPSHPAAPRHAVAGLQPQPGGDRRRHALLLRVQPVQPVRLPRRPRSQERLRAVQARGARQRALLHRNAGVGDAAPDGGLPPRAHDPPDLAAGALRVQQRRPAHRAQLLAQPRDVCR